MALNFEETQEQASTQAGIIRNSIALRRSSIKTFREGQNPPQQAAALDAIGCPNSAWQPRTAASEIGQTFKRVSKRGQVYLRDILYPAFRHYKEA